MSDLKPEIQSTKQPENTSAKHAEKQPELDQTPSGRQLLLQEIGSKLSQTRQAKNETISKAVRHLKIPMNHLQSLENGNWDALPDDIYVIGFLRQYSNYLGLDLKDEINRLKNSDYTLTRPLTFPDPPVAPSRRWAWLTGGAFVLLFVVFNIVSNNNENPAPVTIDHTEQTTTQATSSKSSNMKQPGEPQTTQPEQEKALKNTPSSPPLAVKNSPAQTTKNRTTKPAPVRITDPVTTPAQKKPAKTRMHSFRFEAVTAPVWLQLFAPNQAGTGKGRLLKELLLKKGQHATIRRASESLWITCGNALALRIRVDQKIVVKTGSLSSGKKILRDYRFNIKNY